MNVLNFSFTNVLGYLQEQRPDFILYHSPSYCNRLQYFFFSAMQDEEISSWLQHLYKHDPSTFYHSVDVAFLSLAFSDVFYTENPILFRKGALLHDVGKLLIPHSILQKPGALTTEERGMMQQHTLFGYQLLQKEQTDYICKLALHHHEHPAGFGYPFGLQAENMKFDYFLLRIIDEFSALTLDRCYRKGLSISEAIDIIITNIQYAVAPSHISLLKDVLSLILSEKSEEENSIHYLLASAKGRLSFPFIQDKVL